MTAKIRGVDVSNNQGYVDFAAIATSGRSFAFLKASGDEGGGDNRFLDGDFPRNWDAAREAGLIRGAYHYARPSVASPAQSVGLFEEAIKAVGGLKDFDHVALDIEDPDVPINRSLHVWVAEWLALATRVFGVPPWKYSAMFYTQPHDLEHDDLSRYPTWWASYQATLPAPRTGWGPILMWQHDVTASGVVPGVAGRCDVNYFYGTTDDLKALGYPMQPLPHVGVPAIPPPAAPAPVNVGAASAAIENAWAKTGILANKLEHADLAVSIQHDLVAVKRALNLEAA